MPPLSVHLIDGTYELYRQFYGRLRFEKSGPAPLGAVAGVLHSILEMMEKGAPKPAGILGIPVGFVGAAESKEALVIDSCRLPYLIVRGRIGGSAMTAAAVNALARAGL